MKGKSFLMAANLGHFPFLVKTDYTENGPLFSSALLILTVILCVFCHVIILIAKGKTYDRIVFNM